MAECWDAARLAGQTEFDEFCFINCNFSGADLHGLRFADCLFERCNLSSAQVAGTALENTTCADCKLLGLQSTACRELLFVMHFDRCHLRYASFTKRRTPGTRFVGCTLDKIDFGDADLSASVFEDCSLAGAVFQDTRLVGANFTTASGFIIDPETNALLRARFALPGLPGLPGLMACPA